MQSTGHATRDYSVEVSGWGPGAEFFRECATLRETDNGKCIVLRHPLMAGAILFVRPVSAYQAVNFFPLIFHAQSVGFPDQGGRREVSLVRM